MQWSAGPGAGFTANGSSWLPIGDAAAVQRGGPARGPGLDAAPRARPDRAAALAERPARRRVRDAAGARRRVGLAARRGHRGRAQPLRRGGGGRGRGRARARGDRSRARRRAGRRARSRWRRGPVPSSRSMADVPELDAAALGRGLAVRVDAAGRARRPGALPRAVRPRLADHVAAGAARAAGRGGRHAARAGGAAGAARRRPHARGAGQDRPRVPRRHPGADRGRGLAGRRPVRLLRHGRRHLVVPGRAGGDRRRRAGRRARAGVARRWDVARGRARRAAAGWCGTRRASGRR